MAGEKAAQALKESAQAQLETYNIRYGPLGLQLGGTVRASYTDNAFYSHTNRVDDYVINPEADLGGLLQVSELNTLRFNLGVGYEYYLRNNSLNGNAPLVNPDSELAFNVFVGNFHFRAHDKFSYQETLFINTTPNEQSILFNFTDVTGTFARWDNFAGVTADWDLDKLILSVGYDHENFASETAIFNYLSRASELFTGSASVMVGDHATIGVESQAGIHNYDEETILNDHFQARAGPFVDAKLAEKINLRAGGGYDTARYSPAIEGSYESYYAYGNLSQETRLFTHTFSAGHEHLLGVNANNLEDVYFRYSISSAIVEHVDLGASASVHLDREYGGPFTERYVYYLIGLKAGYQFQKYWRGDVGYEFMLKGGSNLPDRDFYRSRVTLGVTYTF